MKWYHLTALALFAALLGLLSACGEEGSDSDENGDDTDVEEQMAANCDQASWLGFPDYVSGQSSAVCEDTNQDHDGVGAFEDRDDLDDGAREIACGGASDWNCVRSYWADQLESRCSAWESGDSDARDRASEDEYNKYCG